MVEDKRNKNGDGAELEVSDKFLKNIDDLKKKIKTNYTSGSPDSDSEETREFIKRKPGRKRKEVNDNIENIGTDTKSELKKLFTNGFNVDKILESERAMDVVDKTKIRQRYSYGKLIKYIFKDAFGNRCGVFFNKKTRYFLEKMLDVQINCIYDISNADGVVWRVVGVVEDPRYYFSHYYFNVGYVHCVGVGNAVVLGKYLCKQNNCELACLKFVGLEGL